MKKAGETLFRLLGLSISALLLVMSLLYGARLAARNQEAAEAKAAVEALREENQRLRVRCACCFSLEEIDRFAREELGMQPLRAEQILRADLIG